jgi:hypothetical protein|tara:strand:- start:2567 stop:2713 length:147 start_codon:yes stop_codon:yes gene_type:complete
MKNKKPRTINFVVPEKMRKAIEKIRRPGQSLSDVVRALIWSGLEKEAK